MIWFRPGRLAVALWRDHRLITVAVALSLVPRLLAMLAFAAVTGALALFRLRRLAEV